MVAITTQEEFDARISERLKRERETLAKRYEEKYAGYVAKDAHEQAVAELNDQLAAARQAAEESKAQVDGLNATVRRVPFMGMDTRPPR